MILETPVKAWYEKADFKKSSIIFFHKHWLTSKL